ncbi:Licodione synthase [Acorus calamus]|uniref:Licodione synthase n=1 Tax=Acorus calamus TaxID=4465 RepID=A0AAV9C8I6_ACOCL|nr:Licodione synthase [Acorus calamus]
MREGGSVDEARELVKGVEKTIQTFDLLDFVWVLRGVDVHGIKGRIDDVYRRFDELSERIIRREEEEEMRWCPIDRIIV